MNRTAKVIACLDTVAICRLAGVNRSTLDYWVRTRLVVPSLRADPGRRRSRLWTVRDAVVVRTIAGLREAGCPLPKVRKARAQLEAEWDGLSADSTLFWTGSDVLLIGPEGDVESLVSRPFQQAFRLIALPIGGWQAETSLSVMYVREDRLDRGIPASTEAAARAVV